MITNAHHTGGNVYLCSATVIKGAGNDGDDGFAVNATGNVINTVVSRIFNAGDDDLVVRKLIRIIHIPGFCGPVKILNPI